MHEGSPSYRDDGARGDLFDLENVELTTVGIDVGSSTSHVMISKVHLQRLAQSLSSQFVLVRREVLWRSPVILTPYLSGNTIDAAALAEFVHSGYEAAGLAPEQVDSGAVILTGEALKRRNARAIADALANDSGRFVCAAAGHNLEATLAAHGSGAVGLSRERDAVVLNIDIGGGTSKFSLIDSGNLVATAAVEVGGRMMVLEGRRVVRMADAARSVADACGAHVVVGEDLDPVDEERIAEQLSEVIVSMANGTGGGPLGKQLLVTDPIEIGQRPELITFSGGVAEYLYGRETGAFDDLGPALAGKLRAAIGEGRLRAPVEEPDQGIRATVIGASQFSVVLSGNTIGIDERVLPLRNLPVLHASVALQDPLEPEAIAAQLRAAARRMDLDASQDEVLPAAAIRWSGDPTYRRLLALATGVREAIEPYTGDGRPLVVIVDGDIAGSLYHIFRSDLGVSVPLVCLDGVLLQELDYVDVGQLIMPACVVPVIVKSLLFSGDRDLVDGEPGRGDSSPTKAIEEGS